MSSGAVAGLATTKASEIHPEIDPIGRYLVYESDETGRSEIYVRTFPGGGGRWLVSTAGGRSPHWSAGSDELFYLQNETLMSVRVFAKDTFRVEGQPSELFASDGARHLKMPFFAPLPDGQRFLIPRLAGDQSLSMILLENWAGKT